MSITMNKFSDDAEFIEENDSCYVEVSYGDATQRFDPDMEGELNFAADGGFIGACLNNGIRIMEFQFSKRSVAEQFIGYVREEFPLMGCRLVLDWHSE